MEMSENEVRIAREELKKQKGDENTDTSNDNKQILEENETSDSGNDNTENDKDNTSSSSSSIDEQSQSSSSASVSPSFSASPSPNSDDHSSSSSIPSPSIDRQSQPLNNVDSNHENGGGDAKEQRLNSPTSNISSNSNHLQAMSESNLTVS